MRKSPVAGAVEFSVFFVCVTKSVDGIFKPTVIIFILIGIDHKVVANRCEEVVVVAGGCLFVELVPKVKPPCFCQGLAATAEDRKSDF